MASRSNILFVMSDHTNAQAVAPGSQCLAPSMDALACEGLRFSHCYTTNAICSPARASLMTGTYPSTHGMWDCTHTQHKEWVNVSDRLIHWAQRLADAGYVNGYFGKWHVEQTGLLESFGWGEVDTSCGSSPGKPISGTEIVVENEGYRPYVLAATADDGDAPPRHPAFDRGIEFIRRHAGGERPFCCFVSAAEPHDPYVPPKSFLDMYDVDEIRVSPTLREDAADKPEVVERMRAVWRQLTEQDWRRISAAYWAVITFLDSETRRIVDALRETGVYGDTIVIVTSDHGDMLGAHGLATKGVGTPYEEVYNVPLIVRAPGMRVGEDDDHKVSLVDIGPTLLDLCGAEPLDPCQGRSFRDVLEGTADPADWQEAYAEFFGQRFVYTQRIVWHGDWKYVFSPGGVDELYNLAQDPHEERNLAADPASRGKLVEMTRRMWRKMEEIGDQSLFNTHYATLRTAP
ncbi:MAG: sulfatase-like hydrolase/transferase, partial [Planctomycetota bacterium]